MSVPARIGFVYGLNLMVPVDPHDGRRPAHDPITGLPLVGVEVTVRFDRIFHIDSRGQDAPAQADRLSRLLTVYYDRQAGITLHADPALDCGFEIVDYAAEVHYSPWMAEGEDIDQETFDRLLDHYRDQWEPGSMSCLAYAWYPLDPNSLPAPEPRPDLDREFWAQMGRAAYQLTHHTEATR